MRKTAKARHDEVLKFTNSGRSEGGSSRTTSSFLHLASEVLTSVAAQEPQSPPGLSVKSKICVSSPARQPFLRKSSAPRPRANGHGPLFFQAKNLSFSETDDHQIPVIDPKRDPSIFLNFIQERGAPSGENRRKPPPTTKRLKDPFQTKLPA
ncbi:hypothetical protein AVEN_123527-1 [Araneus ventricosus]|uniref:Uncharacterized protein n=1 Tax=Araneus ventricosus TaxID=182803 RepID=A0A4Y2LKR3_ARAVE|nr:hypothetical protein AVEN_123527-1 [Araneus ventricosus]